MPAGKPALVAPSSDAELRALRRRCASALWALVPKRIGRLYFGGGLLLRAIPVWRRTMENTEGYAELKAAGSNSSNSKKKETTKRDNGNDSAKRDYPDRGSLSSSLLMREVEPAAAAQAAQVEPMQARGRQEGTRSESQSGSSAAPPRPHSPSWRSAPAPRPKTGGQGPLDDSASAGADPPPPPPPPNPANIVISPFGEDGDGVDDDTDADADAEDEVILEEIERTILDVFSDAYCNKHLVYSILELILVRLLPELTEKRVWELWEERVPVEV
ncbi:uncharacterized protein B0T15DRAFT_293647 [Chaetomium strumarium]|uniref:PXA domain-containing protein n=1 Tax=Chaetomium strumarium TaxID=1170767 RepID=A0AAJ0LYC4_9PEZI|nr:hypothetical protein B0T15DRAFT_293647 [Chaetomium strumarium]